MANFYVSPTGSDSNPGTLASPFRTISKGESVLAGDDICFIRGGTYNLPFTALTISGQKTLSQYADESITLVLSNGTTVNFEGSASTLPIAPNVTLAQLLTVARTFTHTPPPPPPAGTIWVELYIDNSLKATVFGSSLPLVLNYALTLPRGAKGATKQIQVRVHQ